MSMTNAQAALIAAASLPWQGSLDPGHLRTIKGVADDFKAHLDAIDAKTLRERQQANGPWGTSAIPLDTPTH